jgi:hypothetical protein
MKKIVLSLLIIGLGFFQVKAQKLDVNLGFGSYRVPNQLKFELPRLGFNLNFGLIYQINDKWNMGTSINHSIFNYDRASLANTPLFFGTFITAGKVNSDHLYFSIQRKFQIPFQIEANIGLGLGGYIESSEFYIGTNFDEERAVFRGVSWNREIEFDFHFPITYSIKKVFANKVYLGVDGGTFFDKNFNTRGIFIGPKAGIFL